MVGYADQVSEKLGALQLQEVKIREQIWHTQREVIRATASLEVEMESLKKELVALDLEMHRTVERAQQTVLSFKNVVKKGDLARLQSRIDYWAPEQKISREQFKKMLSE